MTKTKDIESKFLWNLSFLLTLFFYLISIVINELRPFVFGREVVIIGLLVVWWSYYQTDLKFKLVSKKIIHVLQYLIASCLLIYVFFRFIPIYNLHKYHFVDSLCQNKPGFCQLAVKYFFTFKIYRFITLSFTFLSAVFLLFFGLTSINIHENLLNKLLSEYKKKHLMILVVCGMSFIFINQLLNVLNQSLDLLVKSWNNRNLSFEDRFVPYESGIEHHGWIWVYAQFINSHTPKDATIFIPPQNDIWDQEGNKYYFRWFMYPKNLLQSDDAQAQIPKKADYVLISQGGWQEKKFGWPQIELKSECVDEIYLINRVDLTELTIKDKDSNVNLNKDVWGLIKINKKFDGQCP